MIKKFFAVLFFLAAASFSALAQTITVTSVEHHNGYASVVINEVIRVDEIKIDGDEVEFPVYVSGSRQVHPQISFRTRRARDTVAGAIESGRPDREPVRRITYRVTDITPYDREGSYLKAFAKVTFNGLVDVECRIMQSRYDGSYWISWPARPPDEEKGEDSWVDLVSIINDRVRDIVEKDIKETYVEVTTEEDESEEADEVEVSVVKGRVDSPVAVTAVEVERKDGGGNLAALASVELNHAFRISDIKVYERRGRLFLEFPVNVTSTGRQYDQMRIFSRQLRSDIIRAIETGAPPEKEFKEIGFEITKFDRFDRGSSLKYFCAVTINRAIEIECAIIDGSEHRAFVSWPSNRVDGEYVDQITPINRDVREAIEDALLKRYWQATED